MGRENCLFLRPSSRSGYRTLFTVVLRRHVPPATEGLRANNSCRKQAAYHRAELWIHDAKLPAAFCRPRPLASDIGRSTIAQWPHLVGDSSRRASCHWLIQKDAGALL